MSRIFVTVAVLVIVFNDATFGHCRKCKHGPNPALWKPPGHSPERRQGRCHPRLTRDHEEDKISEIVKKYIEADEILGTFCRNDTIVPKITYSTTAYVIKYNLPDTKDVNVTVTIKKPTLATKITGSGVFKDVSDARVLPDILKVSDAVWTFQGTDLKILIPYKVPLGTEFDAECVPDNGSITDIKVPNPPSLKIYRR